MAEQTRKHRRIKTDAVVDYTGSEVLLYHKIENISLGGICIQAATIEEVGTIVELSINFPELDETVEVQGEVVWASHENPKDMGIRFLNLGDREKVVLQKYMLATQKSFSPP